MLDTYDVYLGRVRGSHPCIPVVVHPYAVDVVAAIHDAFPALPRVLLIGDKRRIDAVLDHVELGRSDIEIIDAAEPHLAAVRAAEAVLDGDADYVVKGSLGTADLLKGLLGRDRLGVGRVASHLYLIDAPAYPGRTIAFADAGVNIAPNLATKADIVRNSAEALARLGVAQPLVAALSAVELVKTGVPSSLDAALLVAMSQRGQLGPALVDGPLSIDAALSEAAAAAKALGGDVAGRADLLIAPDIDAANMTSKALIGMGGRAMGVVLGCRVPVSLPSRGDSRTTRADSLSLASHLAQQMRKENES